MIFLKSCIYLLLFLISFFVYRVALFFYYQDYFGKLNFTDVLLSFFNALKFDISISLTFITIFLLFLNLPFKFAKKSLYQKSFSWLIFFVFLAFNTILIGDLIYFNHVKRHITNELFLLQSDWFFIIEILLDHKIYFFVAFLIIFILFFIWKKIVSIKVEKKSSILVFIAVILLCFVGIRGSFDSKPLYLVDAFSNGGVEGGNLTLNGVFSAFHSSRKGIKQKEYTYYSEKESLEYLDLKSEKYPLLKEYKDNKPTNKNIVFVLMESWTPKYIDSISGNSLGVTPNFDSLAKNGFLYSNFYATGQRSIEGIQSSLTSIIPMNDFPELGFGLELSSLTKLGELAKNNGYESIFIQASKRGSFYVDSIASYLGFEHYFGMEDMPILLDYPDSKSSKFGWDYESYMLLYDKLKDLKKPFISFMFTGTTHFPYPILPKQFLKYSGDGSSEKDFYNTIYYSDYALGEFMKKAKNSSWFDDTIFIFSADHVMAHYQNGGFKERFNIPFLIYSPKLFASRVDNSVHSQSDILPTIVDLLGFSDSFYSFGESIFRKDDAFAIVKEGSIMGIFSKNGYITHSYKSIIDSNIKDEKEKIEMEKYLLSALSLTSKLIKENRVAK